MFIQPGGCGEPVVSSSCVAFHRWYGYFSFLAIKHRGMLLLCTVCVEREERERERDRQTVRLMGVVLYEPARRAGRSVNIKTKTEKGAEVK